MMNESANRAILARMGAALRSRPGVAAAAILAAGWVAALALSWPGQLSFDSIVQLHDGRTGFYHSWHPPVMAWLLGLSDAIVPGTGSFVVLDASLMTAAMLALLATRARVSWAAACVAAVCVLLPQFLLYQGIVWKDVLFADSAAAGFACLARADARWSAARARFAWIAGAVVLLALAALTRQNGALVLVVGALALGVVAARAAGRRRGALYAAAALACASVLALSAGFALSLRSDGGEGPVAQLALLRLYDLTGAVKEDPSLPLDVLEREAPEFARLIRSDGVRLYSPERNDTLVGSQPLQNALADAEPGWLAAQWKDLVLRHPALYLKVRARVFAWVLLTPDIVACRPVFTGVEGPAGEMADLGLVPRRDARDRALAGYSKAFLGTPVFSHLFFAVLAFAAMVLLWRRRGPGDIAVAFLSLAAFAFTASFFVVSIACDYRYLYFLDLAALAGAFQLSLDPDYLFHVKAMWSGSFWLLRSDARKS